MADNKVYIVRHAQSEYNAAQTPHKSGEPWVENLDVKISKKYVDCNITELGYE